MHVHMHVLLLVVVSASAAETWSQPGARLKFSHTGRTDAPGSRRAALACVLTPEQLHSSSCLRTPPLPVSDLRNSSALFWGGGASGGYDALLLDEDGGWLLVGGKDHIYLLKAARMEVAAATVRLGEESRPQQPADVLSSVCVSAGVLARPQRARGALSPGGEESGGEWEAWAPPTRPRPPHLLSCLPVVRLTAPTSSGCCSRSTRRTCTPAGREPFTPSARTCTWASALR